MRIDQDEARLLGLSSQAIASVLNTVISGTPSPRFATTSIWSMWWRARPTSSASRWRPCAPCRCRCPAAKPFPSASLRLSDTTRSIRWSGGGIACRRLTVQADIARAGCRRRVVAALAPAIEEFGEEPPRPYRIVVGGTVEESQKSQASVIAVVPVMLLIMLTVLMVQLQSFQRLFMVLSVAPLGLIGVVGRCCCPASHSDSSPSSASWR